MERRHTVDTDRKSSQKNCVEPMSYLEVLTGRRRSSSDEKESLGKKCVITSNKVVQISERTQDKDSTVLGQEDQQELSRKEVPLDISNFDALTTHNSRYEETYNIQEMKQETSWKKSDLSVTYLDALMGRNTQDCSRKTSRKKLSHDSGHGDDLIELNSEEEYLNIQASVKMKRNKTILETNGKDAWTKCKDEDDSVFIEDDELLSKKSPYVNTLLEHSFQDAEVTQVQEKAELLPRRYVDVLTGGSSLDETDSNNENSLMVKSSLAISYVDAVTEQKSQENEDISKQENKVELSWKDALTSQDENGSVDETHRNETFLETPINTMIGPSSQYEEIVTIDNEEFTKIKPRTYTSYVDALIGRSSQDKHETVIVHVDLESRHTKSNILSDEDIATEISTNKSNLEGSDKQREASYRDNVTSQTSQDGDESSFSAVAECQRIESSEDIPVNVTIHLEEKPSHSPQSYLDVLIGRRHLDVETNKEQFFKKEALPKSYASALTGQKYLEGKEYDCIKISSNIPHEETNATNDQRSLDDEDSITIPTSSSPVQEEGHLPLVLENPGSRIISNSIENDPKVLERREKQILYGKNTESYKKYVEIVDKKKRSPRMPRTPNVKCKMNRRQWDGLVRNWKRRIHFTASKFGLDGMEADVVTSGSENCSNWVEIMEEEDRLKEMEEEGKMDGSGSCFTSWT